MSNPLHLLADEIPVIITLLNAGLKDSSGSISITASPKGFAVSVNGRRMGRGKTVREAFDRTINALNRHCSSAPSAASVLKQ